MILIVGFSANNCSMKAPEVNITGEKTALENQVIGTYQEIEQDSWTIASVRSAGPGKKATISNEKKKVLTAVKNRKFNKDDINEFKREGVIGENNQGILEVRDFEKLNKNAGYKKRIEQVVANENKDRAIIRNRTIQINEQVAAAGEKAVARVFAKIYQDESEANTWIQADDGSWIKKKKVK